MKTKTFLLVSFLMGVAVTQLHAQGNDTRTRQTPWIENAYYLPVYCADVLTGEEVLIDYLEGNVMYHIIDHFKDGNWQWEIAQGKGEVTSVTGEVFKVHETDKLWIPGFGIFSWHYNLIGDRGNHYIGFASYSYISGEFTVGKTVCR